MLEVSIIGLDIAKHVFQAHGVDSTGHAVLRRKISRTKLLPFFAAQPPCRVVLEACGGAHHWARELGKLGHDVQLIAPAYVKPFVKRQKNDAADAEAICEAAQRPSMRFVAVKSEAQQAAAMVFRGRDLLVRQRTQISNALRRCWRASRACWSPSRSPTRPRGSSGRAGEERGLQSSGP